jgi:hypothetical protein
MSYSESNLVDKLKRLQQTEESIQTLSQWALMFTKHHKRTVDIWMREFKAATVDRKLLLYFCNDVMQTSRKKTLDFIKAFGKVLPEAFKIVRAERNPGLTKSTNRLLDVWEQRNVFGAGDFVRGLRGGTSAAGGVTYTAPAQQSRAPTQQSRAPPGPRGFSKPHPLVTLEEQITAAEQQVTETERRASDLLGRVQLDDAAINQAVGNGTVGQLQSGVAAARSAFTAQQLAIEAEVRLREKLVVDLQQRADAAAAALANSQAKLTAVAERTARAEACDARINAASSMPVNLSRQESGGFKVGEGDDAAQPAQFTLPGGEGPPVDLFAQLAKVREQLGGGDAPPAAAAVRSPAVDPRVKKKAAAADDAPTSKRQRTEPEPAAGEPAAASGAGAEAAAAPAADAAAAGANGAGAGDLFAQLAQVQQAAQAAAAQAAAGTAAAESDSSSTEAPPGDAGEPAAAGDPSEPVGGPSVDQWNGGDGGIDMGFEVLP